MSHRNGGGATKWHYVALSICLSAFSMLSKEQGVTALVVCAGYDVLLHWRTVQNVIFSWKRTEQGKLPVSENGGDRVRIIGDSNGEGGGEGGGNRNRKDKTRLRQRGCELDRRNHEEDALPKGLTKRVG